MADLSVAERAISRDVAEGVAAVLRALADPLRLQIVSALATSPTGREPAGGLASITNLTAPTVSHHLKSLRRAGVVVSESQGTWVYYTLAPGMDRVVSGLLDTVAAAAAAGQRAHAAGAGRAAPAPGASVDLVLTGADRVMAEVSQRLGRRFASLPTDLVVHVVRESYTALGRTARVTQHLPVLTERFAAQRLEDAERAGTGGRPGPGDEVSTKPHVLFVCVANAGRSQLAAALLRKHAGDAVVVRSAGSMPAADVHATVQPLLAELLADQPEGGAPFPKPLTDDAVRAADVVITMGCGDTCPVLPGKRYEDWAVGDPALASPAGVRAIYDDLEARVRDLAAGLTHPTDPFPTSREIP